MSIESCGKKLLKQIKNKRFTYHPTKKVHNGDENTMKTIKIKQL